MLKEFNLCQLHEKHTGLRRLMVFGNAGELQICFPSRQTSEIILNLPSGREHFLCPEIESQMKTTSIKNYPLRGCTENIAIKYGVSVNHSERYSIKTASSLDPLAEKILIINCLLEL